MRKIILFIFTVQFLFIYSQSNYQITNLTNNDGLSNSSINTIYQDSSGLLWFGTWDGLNIYNSREFKVYKPEVANPYAISNNIIRNIVEQNSDTVWIATDQGIDCFDKKNNIFTHFFIDLHKQASPVENAFLLAKNNSGQIFVHFYYQGLFFFDNELQQFVKIDNIANYNSRKIFFDSDDNLWIYTVEKTLYKILFNKKAGDKPVIEHIYDFKHLKNIEAVFFNPKGNEIWVGDNQNNLYNYNISEGYMSQKPVTIPSGLHLNSILFFPEYQLWGTTTGLYSYNYITQSTETILPETQILSLLHGTQNIIWVGTDMHGVWRISPENENFRKYTRDNISGFGKSAVRSFTERNGKKELWVGTKGEGIFIFDNKTNTTVTKPFSRLTTDNGLLNNSIFVLASDIHNDIWIGTDGKGLNYFSPRNNKVNTLNIPEKFESEIKLSSVYSILPYDENTLWVGTSGYGMYRLEIDRSSQPYSIRSYKQYIFNGNSGNSLSNNIVYSIIKDDDKHLWIGTRGGGLNRFHIETEQFRVYRFSANHSNYISSDDILSLHKDKSGVLWVGTSMGLNKLEHFENDLPVFIRYSENEGIPNNTVHGILEDDENNIWLSTNRGLAKLTRNKDKYRIISYYEEDGLQNNEFSDGAYYKSSVSGELYFGGISGFNTFNPSLIKDNNYMPPLILDAFYIQNKETSLNKYMQLHNGSQALVLKNNLNTLSFKFISLDYIAGSKTEIAYKLEGFDKDWIQLGTSNTLVLSNLSPGKYELKVRNSNAGKIWNDHYFSLPVIILNPWWSTPVAFSVYFILFCIIVYIIYRQGKYRLKAKTELREKELEKQKTEEIHQAKLRFFTNIAHEFSNSLTLIYAPSEQLLKTIHNEDTRKYVNSIRSNAQRMQSLIQQLIEFRKAETGFLKLEIERVDIIELTKYVIDSFIETLEQKKIKLELKLPETPVIWNTDRDGMEKVLFNLISNATKYTPNEETIKINISIKEGHLVLEVTNTGIGIKKSNEKIIFDRFKVLDRFEMQLSEGFGARSGIGLALSKNIVERLNGIIDIISDEITFTTFIVKLPLLKEDETPTDKQYKTSSVEQIIEPSMLTSQNVINIPLTPDPEKRGLILVIDDESEIRNLLKDILSENYEIAEAANGQEAIEIMKLRMPLLIICDVIMPKMNGVEFIQIMKNQELTRHIPVIFLSSKSSIESQIEGIETGADAYLSKPFHPRHLEALVETLIGRNKAITDYNESHYAGMEQYQGKLIHKSDKDLIIRINKIIADNIDEENLSLDYIASETAISKMQLYRKIKEITDQTPTEYIRYVRLKQAEKLLKTTNKTVQEIMYSCGFSNKSYFYREFSKKYHLTPKEYRNKQTSSG